MNKSFDIIDMLNSDDVDNRSKAISFLTLEHIENTLIKKDLVTNVSLIDLGKSYHNRFIKLAEQTKAPLPYYIDRLEDFYQYLIPHINSILNNPHQKIVKERHMIETNRLKVIEPKTFRWLASKPGSTYREKLANTPKILSTKKRYTSNVKENQVLYKFFLDYEKYYKRKSKLIADYPKLFGDYLIDMESIQKHHSQVSRLKRKLKDTFEDVVPEYHTTPNNALIGNRNYAAVWRAYRTIRNIKSYTEDKLSQLEDTMSTAIYKYVLFSLMSSKELNYIEKPTDYSQNDFSYLLYKKVDEKITFYKVELHDKSITIEMQHYSLTETQYKKITGSTKKTFTIKFNENMSADRGLPFELSIKTNNKNFNFDFIGLNSMSDFVLDTLKLDKTKEFALNKDKIDLDYIAINDFSNKVYTSEESHLLLFSQATSSNNSSDNVPFEVSTGFLFFADDENLTYTNSIRDLNKHRLYLESLKNKIDFARNQYIIYDVKDIYDEFSSQKLRSLHHSIMPKSYPVWKSILAVESLKTSKSFERVVDLTSDESYVVKIKKQKNRYIHIGPHEITYLETNVSENSILKTYVQSYAEKYNVSFNKNSENFIINSGILQEMFIKKPTKPYVFLQGNEDVFDIISISFDDDLYRAIKKDIKEFIRVLHNKEFAKSNVVYIVPDFLNMLDTYTTVKPKELVIGANVIQERLMKNEICWYERLPDLSLEVIRDGQYDTLTLIKNKETENVIGKGTKYNIQETFTLSKGKEEYKLPLIKSFIGSNTEFEARITHPSFPLKSDVDVELKLEYLYGSPNSYELTFEAINSESPFEKITVEWLEHQYEKNMNPPKINDVEYTSQQADIVYTKTLAKITSDRKLKQIFSGNNTRPITRNDSTQLFYISNDIQRLYIYDKVKATKLIEHAFDIGFTYSITKVLNEEISFNYTNKWDKLNFRRDCEELHTILVSEYNKKFQRSLYQLPEATVGRALVHNIQTTDEAYSILANIVQDGVTLYNKKLEMFLTRLTAATAVKHDIFLDIHDYNDRYYSFIRYLFDVIRKVLKEITNDKPSHFKSSIFYMKNIIDLLIAYLFLRNKMTFKSLQPGGTHAKELVYLLKEYNKKYSYYIQEKANNDSIKLSSKYRMSIDDKPEELKNVDDQIYCLILFLTGDERANYVKIESGD